MNTEFNQLPGHARVWVYASNKALNEQEQQHIMKHALEFTANWTAHQVPLKASFMIVKDVFLIFGVDTAHHDISGCGIDKSVHLVQQWEKELNLGLFNRMQLEYEADGTLYMADKAGVLQALESGKINDQTPFYNKTVGTVEELKTKFILPFQQSWVYSHLVKQPL